MGSAQSTTAPKHPLQGNYPNENSTSELKNENSVENNSKCPVGKDLKSGCPIKRTKVYNVYGQEVDPTNLMPHNPNQEPKDGQKYPLETERVYSNIPRAGTDGTWVYPSPQMFFNSLRRKGKDEDVREGHIRSIVDIHNNMNERTWKQVIEWENILHPNSDPKLLRFMGKPDDLSPIAYMKKIFLGQIPFDRHDWIVLRNNGDEVRYVIDYYYDDNKSIEDRIPTLESNDSIKSISIYARPAVDTIESLIDRIRFPIKKIFESPSPPTNEIPNLPRKESTKIEHLDRKTVEEKFAKIQDQCKERFIAVKECTSPQLCSAAALALQYCMGNILCKDKIEDFDYSLAKGTADEAEAKFEKVSECIDCFEKKVALVLQQDAVAAISEK